MTTQELEINTKKLENLKSLKQQENVSLIDVMAFKYGGKYRYRVSDTYDTLVWEDEISLKPTENQLEKDKLEYLLYKNNNEYQQKRRDEYPKTEDLLVALWEKVIEGKSDSADDLQLKRQAIKDKYPKPDLEKK